MSQQQRTLLIVDDSPEDRELYRRYLLRDREYSYTFLEATLGQQGLELWQQHQPDAVLVDYRLPDLDGLDFIAQLQPSMQQPCLPVIVVTGQGNEAIAVKAIKAGAQDYLVKEQITPEKLQTAVNGAIETVRLHTQLQQRIERERVVSHITQKIHQSLNLDEILQTTVTEVREFLHTDRVLVFQLKPDGDGTVVAESVGTEWRSLLYSTMYDPCLAEKYLASNPLEIVSNDPAFVENYIQRYCQGYVTAIFDIQDSSIDPCHVELLAQYQVKANLVVPIIYDDRFWGLLIAHNCALPKRWQPLEIDLLKELAIQVGIAIRQAELYQQAHNEVTDRRRVEAELRQSDERLRLALSASRMGTWNWNIQTGTISWSNNLEALFGLEAGEFDGSFEMFAARLHPDDRDRVVAAVNRAVANGEDYDIEFRVVYPNGTIRWALSQGKVFYDQHGQPIQMAGIDLDITERKRSAEALRQSEEFKNRILDSSSDCIQVLSLDGRLLYMNTGGLCLMEIDDLNSYLNTEWLCFWEGSYRQQAEQALTAAKAGEVNIFRGYCPTAKGTAKWWEVVVSPILDGSGQLERILLISRDITDRKKIELLLQESEARLKLAYKATGLGLWDWDITRNSAHVSEEYVNLFGLDPTTEEISYELWLSHLHLDDRTSANEIVSHTIQQQQEYYEDDYRILHPDGIRWLASRGQVFYNAAGNAVRMVGNVQDITVRKQAEIERDRLLKLEQAARAEAERANRIKDEFLTILSHELRSPLNPILGWTKLLQTRKFSETKTVEALATIERNAKLQTQLIDDLLDVAKILRGKLSIDATPVNLTFVIESAIDTVNTAVLSKSIVLHSVLPNIGQVSGDSNRLQQIVWNLLSNAIKFTPKGGRVETRLERVGDRAQIIVSDTGKGINPDFLPYIFESFRQEDVSITRKYGGLGLGLAIVRQLVEAHGGTIKADSPGEGLGATFTVQLPLLNVEPEINQPDELPQQALELTGIRVLTVDDDPDARELLTVLLAEYGAKVLTVASATEVLANLESFQPDVLVSDIGMPEVDGYSLIKQIRTLTPEKGGKIPAIALTAYARVEDSQRAIISGYQRHVTKPLDPEELVQAVVALTHGKLNHPIPQND
ncbi:MAG: response regulator [Nostoc sp.]|uniref:response regulator n=1 Tax=Nostoc sp. TaxID=1180 RepID=UPI002FFBFE7E